ncbi:stress enhanced protein 1, chloroplastic-like [Juglans microcarpa x Juglans regia]|uniref:stress enhanced protein 1, chloroplastic-like n=1 Tax=Juglans microcarpa x Juglans regia TaxID=2249226 RepID=UPI001B7F71D8|nr:stress enhanced protein 1, chloroplastic-like [Juglans microcarpa x Juglans regia]
MVHRTRVTLAFPILSGLLHKVRLLTSIAAPMALAAPTSASLSLSFLDVRAFRSATAKAPAATRLPLCKCSSTRSSFATGSPLLIHRTYCRKPALKAMSFSIRCEQSTKDANSVDVWLGRLAMVGFAVAISVEIATGKGLLENFGLTSPLPTVALAITGLVGVLTAIFIFQSASKD